MLLALLQSGHVRHEMLAATDWAAWLTAIGTLATAAILAATGLLAKGALDDAKRTRHAQVLISLSEQWSSETISESFKLFGKYSDRKVEALIKRLFAPDATSPSDDELDDYEKLTAPANFIENIGVLRSERAITPDVIYKAWGGAIIEAWAAWHLAVPLMRNLTGEGPDLFRYFEEVSKEMRSMARKRGSLAPARDSATASVSGSQEAEQEELYKRKSPESLLSKCSGLRSVKTLILLVLFPVVLRFIRRRRGGWRSAKH